MQNIEQFNRHLSALSERPVTQQDASVACNNLSGFMSLLMKINEREQVVPTKPSRKPPHADQ